jgi:hypothetical protein
MAKINEMNVLKEFKQDLQDSANKKANIDSKIIGWLKTYDSKEDARLSNKGRSSFIVRLVRRQVKTQTDIITDAFTKANALFTISGFNNKTNQEIARMNQVINHIWKNKTKRKRLLIHDGYTISAKEGTAIGKIGLSNGIPSVVLVRNETVFQDPTATDMDSCQYIIHKMQKTLSDLRKMEQQGVIKNVEQIILADAQSAIAAPNSLATYRDTENNIDTVKEFSGARKKYDVYEYWGYYDINGDGIAEPVVCMWCGNTILRLEESPFGDNLPFIYIGYDRDPNGFWGDSIAEQIDTNQKVITALARSIVENAAYANNNMRAIKKGTIDYTNRKVLDAGVPGSSIETNGDVRECIMPLPIEPLNPQVFQMLELFKSDAEEQTGINRNMNGITTQYTTATESSIGASYGEKRILGFVERSLETFWIPMVRMFAYMVIKYMPQEEIIRITGDDDFVEWGITPEDLDITINISGLDTLKAQQMINLLQYTVMAAKDTDIEASVLTDIVSKICEIQGFSDIADKIRDSKPQPNEAEMMQAQTEMMKTQSEMKKMEAETQKILSDIDTSRIKAMNAAKTLQIREAMTAANIERGRADTIIKATSVAKGEQGGTANQGA